MDIDLCEPLDPCNVNLNDINQGGGNEPKLQVGDVFSDWNSVHVAVTAYAKHHGFVAIKNHKNLDSIDKSISWTSINL